MIPRREQQWPAQSIVLARQRKQEMCCYPVRWEPEIWRLIEVRWALFCAYSGLLLIGVLAERITTVMPFHLFLKRRQIAAMETASLPRIRSTDVSGGQRQLTSVEIYGRRYLCEVPYVLPKDRTEGERLDFQHFLLRHM